jgi:hypothetical protein
LPCLFGVTPLGLATHSARLSALKSWRASFNPQRS